MGGDSINESGLLMCSGCILCNTSIYTDFPACIGWSGKFKVLCLEGAFCLKLGTPTMKCICCDLSISKDLLNPIWKTQCQQCCIVNACAIPPDSEVPATLGMCFIFVYPSIGVCKTQGMLRK
ncbi:hypothetical protein KFE25_004222 [Diacronema lutheri]|uniref:Uncharacterized protein n=1 Tax=Diacronema lutheri TaxID=2081491 RepID=A0A8J6C8Y1_DIALT|nr:hypothetical protein KFE25_004222 [Diacronema lutheri]